MIEVLLWVLALLLVLVGVAGTLLPALPGTVLVFCGLLLAAWLEDFQQVGFWTLGVLGALVILSMIVDFLAGALGVKRMGASPRAFWGAAIGSLIGIFFGLPGLLLGPFLGAIAGELTSRRDLRVATRAGYGAWLGLVLGTVLKLGLAFMMVGIFVTMRLV